jgi:hypothetical protein
MAAMAHRETSPGETSAAAARAVWALAASSGGDERGRAARARRRGALQTAVGIVVAALLGWLWRPAAGWVVGGIAVALGILALLSPLGAFAVVSRGFERLGSWIGAALTWILLGALHLLVFLPLGLTLRVRRRLRITLGFDARLPSYWTASHRWRQEEDGYRRQF